MRCGDPGAVRYGPVANATFSPGRRRKQVQVRLHKVLEEGAA